MDALKELFAAMPADSGMAFIVIQHLEPTHESRMAEILAKSTTMQVAQAQDDTPVRPNTVYTNPSDRAVRIRNGRLALGRPVEGGHVETAIDQLLVSLAEDQGSRAVCIILSGSSGLDGPRGVRAVRAAGGMCMAQDPATAQFPAMPQAAIDTGLVDYVLPLGRMPEALVEFVRNPQFLAADREGPAIEGDWGGFEAVIKLLLVRTASDYRHYKRATVLRRIQRRMGLRQITDTSEYVRLLQKDPHELVQLGKDMLIGVSSFFRDPEAFDQLRTLVIEPLVAAAEPDAPLRAWVAGCATGEEAYSVAMLLLEARSAAGKAMPIQVFATDIDDKALAIARVGAYPLSVAEDLSPERLRRFLAQQGQTYRVDKQLREAVVFSRHNLLSDPPFSKLDLVTCRNVLIYLEPSAQKKVLAMFSFALNVGGHMVLGRSEGVAGMEDLFEPVDKPNRIYRLVRSNRRAAGDFPLYPYSGRRSEFQPESPEVRAATLTQTNLEAILQHFGASVVLVDAEGKILYFHGQTEKYLGHPKGPASLNILDMTAGTLSAKLRRAMDRAFRQDQPARLTHVPLPGDRTSLADLTVMRVADRPSGPRLLAILFEDARPPRSPATTSPVPAEDEALVAQLEAEVKAVRNELRSNAEAYDSASEEVKAANEEVMSMNEELQSTNEELEASKEELQSINEELTTLNSQLGEKVNELNAVNNDLANLLNATQVATVFLDAQLRVKRFTPWATGLLNLIDLDIGRPITHVTHRIVGLDLAAAAEGVLRSLTPLDAEAQCRDGLWYTVRILPYRTLDDRIDGVVITFADVNRLKRAEGRLQYEKTYAETIVETVRHPLLVLDGQLRVLSANAAFYELFRARLDHVVGQMVYDLGDRQWNIPPLRQLLEEVIPSRSAFQDFRIEHVFPQIGRKVMLLSGRRIERAGEVPPRILVAFEDVTDAESDRQMLQTMNVDLEQRVVDRTALADRRSEQLRELSVELTRSEQRERERLARLLHDNLQQLLVGSKYQLRALRSRVSDEAAGRSVDLITDLIDQSLSTSRTLTMDLSPTILYEADLHAALPWLARQMEAQHGLEVQSQINAAVLHDEEGMAIMLFTAVRELLMNVSKHAGVRSARVRLDRVDADHVRVVVSDEGVGFDPAKMRAGEGATGLGLFGLQQRLEHVGGRCEIDSAPGRGTRVTLTVKLPEPVAKAPSLRERLAWTGVAEAVHGPAGMIRVLLVDDHVIVRQGLMSILSQEPDIEVIAEATSGQEAIDMAHQLQPDVVIMDFSLPGLSGVEATRRVTSELPGTKVIGLSMYEDVDRADAMREAGASTYLSKGGPSKELLAAVRSAAGAKQP